jgi:hypothetical protein
MFGGNMRVTALLTVLLLFGCEHRGPKTKSVRVPPDSTWATLREHLHQGVKEGCVIIKVNGAPFYMACYSPYGDPHERPARMEEPSRVIASGEPVESLEPWVAGFHLRGALVRIGADVPVSRLTRLAEILDHHRITATWSAEIVPGSSITIWQTTIYSGYVHASTNAEQNAGGNAH